MSSRHYLTRVLVILVLSVSPVVLAPSEVSHSDDTGAQTAEKPRYVRTGAEGALSGKILFEDEAPSRKRIDMSQDAICAETSRNPRTEDVIVNGDKLANVFVYVKSGNLARFQFETPETNVVLDQQRCRFVPRVLGIQTGQHILVFNSDPTTHNVHPAPKYNPEWNQSQMAHGTPIETKFMRAETMIPVKCNQHPWMKAYVGVLTHPFFAVSTTDGSFMIDGLPPGDYSVVAWHEILGEQTATVTIEPAERKSVDFTFGTTSSSRRSSVSLKIESPIVVQ
ncbi:MAG TPA: carboxypeptidase regulatory-like domain-containing protein [Blastocatellia bacterium]|nr:carboxypeptidase regulatory-like domain-containing protein [Blastocatellia bacterium]